MAWGRPIRDPVANRLEQGVLAGIATFRMACIGWMVIVVVMSRDALRHPIGVLAALAVAVAWTLLMWRLVKQRSPLVLRAPTAVAELAIGFGLLAADGWVYGDAHPQGLGSAWPIAGAMSLGVIVGPAGGLFAGIALGLGRLTGTMLDDLASPPVLSLVSTGVLYGLAGTVAGFAMRQLRGAEMEISAARAREEVARTLHDGVLQTLAVVQRRSSDPDLAALAREQEWELREYLFGVDAPGDGLVAALRAAAGRHQRHHPGRVEVIVIEEPVDLPVPVVEALVGATREALNNAAKHGDAARIVIYVDPDDEEVFVSVKDDGHGFEVTETTEGTGIAGSIRARLDGVGGRAEVDGRPGSGTEVRLWAPRKLPHSRS